MKETLLRGLPRLGLTMNGMERKVVVERSATLECNEVKRKPPAAGIGRRGKQTNHALHLRQEVGVKRLFALWVG